MSAAASLSMKSIGFRVWGVCLGIVLAACASTKGKLEVAPDFSGTDRGSRVRVPIGTRGIVVSDDRMASAWGAKVLKLGGNAVDAAVATAFHLAVTRPHYASLGGGGFLLYCPEKAPKCSVIDYREIAPRGLTIDSYRPGGKLNPELSQDGALASGVPGVVSGLLTAHGKWGKLPRALLLSEPIRVAREGFPFTSYMETVALERWDALNPEAKRVLGCAKGEQMPTRPCMPGTVFRQPDLANTLERISREGVEGFYAGRTAKLLAGGIRAAGGVLTEQDLSEYHAKEREPLVGSAFGKSIVSMPPPSSGGAILLELLTLTRIVDEKGLLAGGFGSASMLHAVAHAQSIAFADRALYFGDPDFVAVPLASLLEPARLKRRFEETFRPSQKNIPSEPADVRAPEPTETTHFVAADREGNMVSITTTINDNYGSGFIPPGTGVVMNDEMDDFSLEPGVPNLYGLVGGFANAVKPGKRPLSSMSPTIVRSIEGSNLLAIGGAGGPRIPTAVYWALLSRYRFGMSLPDAVAAPRLHHQWKPEWLSVDRYGFGRSELEALTGMGYTVKETAVGARLHALERISEEGEGSGFRTWGAPDPRGEGAAVTETP